MVSFFLFIQGELSSPFDKLNQQWFRSLFLGIQSSSCALTFKYRIVYFLALRPCYYQKQYFDQIGDVEVFFCGDSCRPAFQQAAFRVPAEEIPYQSLSIGVLKKAAGDGKNKSLKRRN